VAAPSTCGFPEIHGADETMSQPVSLTRGDVDAGDHLTALAGASELPGMRPQAAAAPLRWPVLAVLLAVSV
jgi:hypothetical protein